MPKFLALCDCLVSSEEFLNFFSVPKNHIDLFLGSFNLTLPKNFNNFLELKIPFYNYPL